MPESHFRTIEIADLPLDGGRLSFVTCKSQCLKGRGDVTLYIPGQVKAAANVPVVILLHGVFCSHWAWALKGKAHLSLQAMIENDEIPPMILAMPSDGLWGDGSGYFPHNDRDYGKWIVEDIPNLVNEVTGNSIDAPHFIGGLSMGGFGAMCLGASYPERFKAFSGHSSVTTFAELGGFVEEGFDGFGIAPDEGPTIYKAILANREKVGPFRFDCGTEDDLIKANRKLARQLTDSGFQFNYEEFPGGHEWSYWEAQVRKTFAFFAALL